MSTGGSSVNGGGGGGGGGGMNRPNSVVVPMNAQQQQNNGGVINGAAAAGANGNNGYASMAAINASQQMDVNFIYEKLKELGDVVQNNRTKAQGIINGAEELAVSCYNPSS